MTETEQAYGRLAEMFEGGRVLPSYEFDALFGAKPWWPSLREVWHSQGVRPKPGTVSPGALECWEDAWNLLQELYRQYCEAKESRR